MHETDHIRMLLPDLRKILTKFDMGSPTETYQPPGLHLSCFHIY